jgi:hypothetical protein
MVGDLQEFVDRMSTRFAPLAVEQIVKQSRPEISSLRGANTFSSATPWSF